MKPTLWSLLDVIRGSLTQTTRFARLFVQLFGYLVELV